ncbi:MAG: glycosyltransferase family 2 protein [Bacteroidales bacterium]|nr:glycosyltransferase family 2 protein [Bacteroidales bacterium]
MKKASAIICAYNEEKTIEFVIRSVNENYLINDVIIVNDGSTDNTGKIIESLKNQIHVKDIHFTENKGKGYAMAIGIENSLNNIIVFIDADLSKLNQDHYYQLINPIIEGKADMVLGQATETTINYKFNPFKSITGERALKKADIIPIIDKMKKSRFGVETLINLYYQSAGKTVEYVMLKGLVHPTKFQKTSLIQASKQFVSEGHEIATTAFKNFDLISGSIKNSISKSLNI